MSKSKAEDWMEELINTRTSENKIGVKIECRILLDSLDDFEIVTKVLDDCRCYGSAEIVEQIPFNEAETSKQTKK